MATPPIHAKGVYVAEAPYSIPGDVSYTCVAIRTFAEVESEENGGVMIDVYKEFYESKDLAREVYLQDKINAVSIITLFADDRPSIRLPSSYIKSYPLTIGTGYSRLVLGIDIGVFPENFDLTYVKEELAGVVSGLTGLTVEVTENYAPFTGVITPEQAQAFENNRKAAIENRETFYAKVEQQQREIERQRLVIARYEELLLQKEQ